jgi:hypothetical protein
MVVNIMLSESIKKYLKDNPDFNEEFKGYTYEIDDKRA